MAKKTFEIELDGELLEWAETYADVGPYKDVQGFLRALLKRDRDEVTRLVKEGMDSGISPRNYDEILADIKAKRDDAAA